MGGRFYDIDAAVAESSAPPVVIRLFGEDWELPSAWPAAVPLLLARWMADGSAAEDLTVAQLLSLVEAMVPTGVVDEWKQRGINVDQLTAVVLTLVAEYRTVEDPDADPEAAPPTVSGAST